MMFDVVAHHVGQQAIELAIVREHDVTASIPGEPRWINDRRRQTPWSWCRFEDPNVAMAELEQLACTRQPARPAADDHHPPAHHERMLQPVVDIAILQGIC
jgi:hypothetical protein